MVSVDQSIDICMPGGTVRVLVNQYGEISLQATAHCVFEGTLPLSMLEVAPERPRGDEALLR